jgi:hypothetical protein
MTNPISGDIFISWVRSFPEERVVARIDEIEAELDQLRAALDQYREIIARVGPSAASGSSPASGEPLTTPHHPNLRQAILALMAEEDRVWASTEIREELRARGWMVGDDRGSVNSALSRMAKQEELERQGYGRYRFRRDTSPPGHNPLITPDSDASGQLVDEGVVSMT